MSEQQNMAIALTDLFPWFFLALLAYGFAEFGFVHFKKHAAKLGEYKMMGVGLGVMFVAFGLITLVVAPLNAVIIAFWATSFAPWHAGLSPSAWIYGLVVYELAYWFMHWMAHKIRFLWCIHSPHHAPESMSMFVGFNHSFIESIFYFPFMLGFIPAVLGVHPLVIAVVAVIDAVWGNILHVSDNVVTRRWGILERFMQTPSFHRVHHAQNIRYMDTNYTSITLLWDWVLGTLQPLDDSEAVDFGITRDVNTSSFWDTHFGDFVLLWQDMRNSPTLKDALLYLLMPPGWARTGELKTATFLKQKMAEKNRELPN